MLIFILPISINTASLPDMSNDLNLLKTKIFPLEPMFQGNLETKLYCETNLKNFMRHKFNFSTIHKFKRPFSIALYHFLHNSPFELSLVNIFWGCFDLASKFENEVFKLIEIQSDKAAILKIYCQSKLLRENLNSLLKIILPQTNVVSPQKNYRLNSFFIFAIAEIRAFLKEISFYQNESTLPNILLSYKIECFILYYRIKYYLSLLSCNDYFYEEFLAYKYTLRAILYELNNLFLDKLYKLEKIPHFYYKIFMENKGVRYITKFAARYDIIKSDEFLFTLYLVDGLILFREITNLISFVNVLYFKIGTKPTVNGIYYVNMEYLKFLNLHPSKVQRIRNLLRV